MYSGINFIVEFFSNIHAGLPVLCHRDRAVPVIAWNEFVNKCKY